MSGGNTNVIFTIGRMNPPTSGHMHLVEKMILKAIELNASSINIILSDTIDNEKNPLECGEKRQLILEKMIDKLKQEMKKSEEEDNERIDEIQTNIICMNDETHPVFGKNKILKSVRQILSRYQESVITLHLIVGEDRAIGYQFIKDHLPSNVQITIESLPRPESAMSATYIRNLVKTNQEVQFKKDMESTGLDESSLENLYAKLKNRLKPNSKEKSKKLKTKEQSKSNSKKRKFVEIGGRTKKYNKRRTHKRRKSQKKTVLHLVYK
jgi:nicotinic acid mononucleotide adenylyltransferase